MDQEDANSIQGAMGEMCYCNVKSQQESVVDLSLVAHCLHTYSTTTEIVGQIMR